MKTENLVPLYELPQEMLVKLYEEDERFAWKVREFVNDAEGDPIAQELHKAFNDVQVDWEFGAWQTVRFEFEQKDIPDMYEKILWSVKYLVDNTELDDRIKDIANKGLVDCQAREKLEDIEPENDEEAARISDEIDHLNDNIKIFITACESEIKRFLRSISTTMEQDAYNEQFLMEFADCYTNYFYDTEDHAVYQITRVK